MNVKPDTAEDSLTLLVLDEGLCCFSLSQTLMMVRQTP